jgi:hypothetical protein
MLPSGKIRKSHAYPLITEGMRQSAVWFLLAVLWFVKMQFITAQFPVECTVPFLGVMSVYRSYGGLMAPGLLISVIVVLIQGWGSTPRTVYKLYLFTGLNRMMNWNRWIEIIHKTKQLIRILLVMVLVHYFVLLYQINDALSVGHATIIIVPVILS